MHPGNPARARAGARVEVPTLLLLAAIYAAWALLTIFAAGLGPWLAVPLLGVVLAQHSSLQHEVIHGHPFRDQRLNDALVFPALGLVVPYERFRDLHLAHHYDPLLTDPHDDPESNYLDPAVWSRLRRPVRAVLAVNNTLVGRMVIGPVLGTVWLWRSDLARDPRRRPAGGPGLWPARARRRAGGAVARGRRHHVVLALSSSPAGWRCRCCASAPFSSIARMSATARAA